MILWIRVFIKIVQHVVRNKIAGRVSKIFSRRGAKERHVRRTKDPGEKLSRVYVNRTRRSGEGNVFEVRGF